jgi:hypothetical protein
MTPGHVHSRSPGEFAIISSHRYVKPGTYQVSIVIRDGLGRKIATQTLIRVLKA